jgi:hypothetical protein
MFSLSFFFFKIKEKQRVAMGVWEHVNICYWVHSGHMGYSFLLVLSISWELGWALIYCCVIISYRILLFLSVLCYSRQQQFICFLITIIKNIKRLCFQMVQEVITVDVNMKSKMFPKEYTLFNIHLFYVRLIFKV